MSLQRIILDNYVDAFEPSIDDVRVWCLSRPPHFFKALAAAHGWRSGWKELMAGAASKVGPGTNLMGRGKEPANRDWDAFWGVERASGI